MMRPSSDWQSFWDLATPQQGAIAMTEIYGGGAFRAISGCAAAALKDNRTEDYRFWTAVLAYLQEHPEESTGMLN
jgi:hypothetical protein